MTIPIILLGNKPLTYKVAQYILDDSRFALNGLILGDENSTDPSVEKLRSIAKSCDIPCYQIDHFNQQSDNEALAVSIGYPCILTTQQIALFKKVINLHFGELPWYRGSATVSHAILNGERSFGMTLHKIDEGVDTGPVYKIECFQIGSDAIASEVMELGERTGYRMIKNCLAAACLGTLPEVPQITLEKGSNRSATQYYRKSLEKLKVLDGSQKLEQLSRQYRAACLPRKPAPIVQFGAFRYSPRNLSELRYLKAYVDILGISESEKLKLVS
ncbi:MAG: formyltransferase family protein [Proteobacteria bacterium]|nr:formyltransferase family protein [Pseudomonadota bacterium]